MKNRVRVACAAALIALGLPALAQYTPPSSATPTQGAPTPTSTSGRPSACSRRARAA